MNSSVDLNLLLLARQGDNLTSELPDLYAVTPPRRTARGRESDSLIIYLSMTGNSPLTPEAHTQLLEQLAHKFYKTTGSLTAALRTIVEAINLYLLDRNLHSTSVGRQGIGQLLLVALRADMLYIAQCGNVHAFVITPEKTQHLYDPQSSGRGLGFSRTTPIRFLQAKLNSGDYLVLATIASSNWSESNFQHPAGVEEMRNRLLDSTSQDFNAVIVQAQSGAGKLRLLRRRIEEPPIVSTVTDQVAIEGAGAESPTTPIKAMEGNLEKLAPGEPSMEEEQASLATELTAGAREDVISAIAPGEELQETNQPEALTSATSSTTSMPSIASEIVSAEEEDLASRLPLETTPDTLAAPAVEAVQPGIAANEPAVIAETAVQHAEPISRPKRERRADRPNPFAKYLTSINNTLTPMGQQMTRALRNAMGTIGAASLRLLKNLLPDSDVLHVPPSVLVFIAVAIPLVLAVVGATVFLQRGRAQQYQIYYEQASEQAIQAASLTNPLEQRAAIQAVIADLDKAEYYTVTSQSQELRKQMVAQLDALDAVKRLDYKQAIVGGLNVEANITRMIATTTDLYMLDSKQGNVLHAIMTGRGYELDPNFQCGPTYGPINVGALVDIAELPPGSFENASLLGMDANGNLLYCIVGSQPYSAAMAPPNAGFGEPNGMSLDRGDLYVLDTKVNAVWIYPNMEVTQQPHLFFSETVPPMQDVIDMVIYNNDLFLLHADGHITKCTYSSMVQSPTRCDDPFPYSDNRPGRTHGPVIREAVFNQIYFSSFPERSIYMLDPQNRSIYYFSLLMTLQWQYQSTSTLGDGKGTAFAISPNRMAFLAVGNIVYYAAIP